MSDFFGRALNHSELKVNKKNLVRVFEVGPRDGLQNEPLPLPIKDKIWLINQLVKAGFQDLEIGAFVRPDRVPQMADTEEVFKRIQKGSVKLKGVRAWSLVPNQKGLERALSVGASHIAVFTAATESFAKKNIGMSIDDSLLEFSKVIQNFKSYAKVHANQDFKVRGYVSTAFGCPFEGKVAPKKVLRVIEKLAKMGADEISIGDTIGVGTPNQVDEVVGPALKLLGVKKVAVHFHDTRGTALANTLRSLELGVRTIDSSAGGLGGCPYAPGASGNLATEDLLYLLHGMGLETGIHLDLLCDTSLELARRMNRVLPSKYLQAYSSFKLNRKNRVTR